MHHPYKNLREKVGIGPLCISPGHPSAGLRVQDPFWLGGLGPQAAVVALVLKSLWPNGDSVSLGVGVGLQ